MSSSQYSTSAGDRKSMVRNMVKLQLVSVIAWNTLSMDRPTLSKPAICVARLASKSWARPGAGSGASGSQRRRAHNGSQVASMHACLLLLPG